MTVEITALGRNRQTGSGLMLIALHLLPGLLFAGFFFLLSRTFIEHGLTGYLALLVSIPVCLAPIELGVMLLWSVRTTGRKSLKEAILYRQQGTTAETIGLSLLLLICWGALSIVMAPTTQFLDAHLTSWLPAWTSQEALINNLLSSSHAQRVIAIGLGVLLSGFVAPIVEELYFRGFLLPRMEHWGWAAPVVNSLLFALYHFYFPGNVPGIFVVFTPIAYVVMLKKNWRIGLIVHSLINLWGVFTVAQWVL